MLRWKIVGASKALVLYIYIDYVVLKTLFKKKIPASNTNSTNLLTPTNVFLLKPHNYTNMKSNLHSKHISTHTEETKK